MKRIYWVFVLIILALSLFVEYDVAERSTRTARKEKALADAAAAKEKAARVQKENTASLQEKIQDVANEIDPDETDENLRRIAAEMSVKDVKQLSKVMSDRDRSGDERAIALEILSRHQSVESLKELEKFVRRYEAKPTMSGTREFESVLRAQAIEGIASFPQKELAISSLSALDPQVEEVFLKDRIRRSMVGLQNEIESEPSQESQSLKTLVE